MVMKSDTELLNKKIKKKLKPAMLSLPLNYVK